MNYIKIKELDYEHTFFHFTRIANKESIQENGLLAVAGGENEAGNDSQNPTIYFSYGVDGMLKAIDVWIKWEYNKMLYRSDKPYISPIESIDEEIMKKTYEKVYNDFKKRMYLQLKLKEGKNPITSDFSFDSIDKKKLDEYQKYQERLKDFYTGKQKWKPSYPNKVMQWMYGSYSDFTSLQQENWNMNTHIGERKIPIDRIRIIENDDGRTDALSLAIKMYDLYRECIPSTDLSRLDSFMEFAKEKYKDDKDYEDGMPDIGRQETSKAESEKYKRINHIRQNPRKCRLGLLNRATSYIKTKFWNKIKENERGENNDTIR